MTRRTAFTQLSAAAAATALAPQAAAAPPRTAMGLAAAGCGMRFRRDRQARSADSIEDTINFLAYANSLGAGGVQTRLGSTDASYGKRVRNYCEENDLYFEAQLTLPRDNAALGEFQSQVKAARIAGATLFRSVNLSGRRYETFSDRQSWREFVESSWRSLTLAEPILRKHRVKLALENHKDWRLDEMIQLLDRLSSEFVGVTLDTGNNIALLDDPMQVVSELAPHALAVHLKDMGVTAYDDGFLLGEVPFGSGVLDIKRVVDVLRAANPSIRFSCEMMTRDPLKIPVWTDRFWETMESVPGADLAQTMRMVRSEGEREFTPVGEMTVDERVQLEEENNRKCLAYMTEIVGV